MSEQSRVDYSKPHNQTVYVDGATGFTLSDGVCRFNLTQEVFDSNSMDGTSDKHDIVACRIAIPLTRFAALSEWINDLMGKLESEGVIRRANDSAQQESAASEASPEK